MAEESALFEEHKDPATENGANPPAPQLNLPDNVKEMIGPGKKYASVEKALEALGHSQQHIAKIEKENADLRGAAAGGVTQEEVLRTVRELLDAERDTHGAAPQVDEAAIAGLLDRKLTEREEAVLARANQQVVSKKLKDKFGDKAKEHYLAVAESLQIPVKMLDSIVAKSPDAASKLLQLEPVPANAGTATKGTVNTSALPNQVRPSPPAKSVMRGASMGEVMSEWKRHDPRQKQE